MGNEVSLHNPPNNSCLLPPGTCANLLDLTSLDAIRAAKKAAELAALREDREVRLLAVVHGGRTHFAKIPVDCNVGEFRDIVASSLGLETLDRHFLRREDGLVAWIGPKAIGKGAPNSQEAIEFAKDTFPGLVFEERSTLYTAPRK